MRSTTIAKPPCIWTTGDYKLAFINGNYEIVRQNLLNIANDNVYYLITIITMPMSRAFIRSPCVYPKTDTHNEPFFV